MKSSKQYLDSIEINLDSLFKEVDLAIKNSDFSQARIIIKKINIAKLPRNKLIDYCQACRRLGLPARILKCLQAVIRNPLIIASEMEQALYAVGLYLSGAYKEAEQIFEELLRNPQSANNEIYFLSALCQMRQWKYQSALTLLSKYQTKLQPDEYSYVVCKLNIAACLQALGRTELALIELSVPLQRTQFELLNLHAQELHAQILFSQGKYEISIEQIRQIYLKTNQRHFILNCTKWQLLSQIHIQIPIQLQKCNRQNNRNGLVGELSLQEFIDENVDLFDGVFQFKKACVEADLMEHVRDFDFHLAFAIKDQRAICQLWQLTHSASYKNRIANRSMAVFRTSVKKLQTLSFGLVYSLQERKIENSAARKTEVVIFQMLKGIFLFNGEQKLRLSGMLLKTFKVVISDAYRGFQIGEVFKLIYPGEYYDINTSPKRVMSIVSRLNQRLRILKSVQIVRRNNRLQVSNSFNLTLDFTRTKIHSEFFEWICKLNLTQFRIEELCAQSQLSRKTILRRLAVEIKNSHVQKLKPGFYKLLLK